MLVTDELKRRKRTVGLMFFDFVEALARLADLIGSPPLELLAKKPVYIYYSHKCVAGSICCCPHSLSMLAN